MIARNCPECGQQLTTECFHGVNLDICAGCAGLWFTPEELHKLIHSDPIAVLSLDDHVLQEIKSQKVPASHADRPLHCPACNLPLEQQRYEYNSPIRMDVCPNCGGFWMLEKDLHNLQHWLDQERQPLSEEQANKIYVALQQAEHEEEMLRHERMRQFFVALQQRVLYIF